LVAVETQLHSKESINLLQHFLRARTLCVIHIAQTFEVDIKVIFAAGELGLEIFLCSIDQVLDRS
jgi:hypothetical protein